MKIKIPDLTNLINRRLDRLKNEISSAPSGGGLESLRAFLLKIERSIEKFLILLDEIEKKEVAK